MVDMSDTTAKQIVPKGPVWDHKKSGRARVSNHMGRMLLPDIDGRRLIARRFRDIASAVASDMGGVERLSEVRKQLIRRFAAASVLAEQREARMARGEEIDLVRYALLCSTLIRLAGRIGLDRMAIDVIADSTTLADILSEARRSEE